MNWQQKIDSTRPGGTVWLPKGVIVTPPLRLRSNIRLLGQGRHQTILRLAPGTQADCVVGTDGFAVAQTMNMWNYSAGHSPQPAFTEQDGLHMGVVVEKLTIDGNRRSGARSGGLHLYGSFTVQDVGVMDCSGHGVWTQCGRAGNSWDGDAQYRYSNMHESLIENLFVCGVGGHGVLYRGPNDSYMDRVQVKMAGETGVLIDHGDNFGTGGLKFGTLHAYSMQGPAFEIKTNACGSFLYCDTPGKQGLVVSGSGTLVDKVLVTGHKTGVGVELIGDNNYIGYLRYVNSPAKNGLLVTGHGNLVPHGRVYGAMKGEGIGVVTALGEG